MPAWALILIGVGATIVIIAMLFFAYVLVGAFRCDSFKEELPWMKWLTLKDAALATNRSVLFCRAYLALLIPEDRDIEFEPLPTASEELKKEVRETGFAPWEASHFRYRLVHRDGSRRKSVKKKPLYKWIPNLQPSYT